MIEFMAEEMNSITNGYMNVFVNRIMFLKMKTQE